MHPFWNRTTVVAVTARQSQVGGANHVGRTSEEGEGLEMIWRKKQVIERFF